MKGDRNNKHLAEAQRLYCAEYGVTPDAAKKARRNDLPKWNAFWRDYEETHGMTANGKPIDPRLPNDELIAEAIRAAAGDVEGGDGVEVIKPEQMESKNKAKDAASLSDPEKMERALINMWASTYRQWFELATGGMNGNPTGDPMVMASLAITITKIRAEYGKAMDARMKYDLDRRKFINIDELYRLRTEFFLPIRDALRNMPFECGPIANPGNHEAGRQGCLEWLDSRMAPVIERAIVKLTEEYTK